MQASCSAPPGVLGVGPLCLQLASFGRMLMQELSSLRSSSSLIDLDVVCEEQHFHVHKTVLAAASTFFKDKLCRANVVVPVVLRLEDFGLLLSREAVSFVIEFIYRGEVLIPGEKLADVCQAAHSLGVRGLVDFLPNSSSTAAALAASGSSGKSQEQLLSTPANGQQFIRLEPSSNCSGLSFGHQLQLQLQIQQQQQLQCSATTQNFACQSQMFPAENSLAGNETSSAMCSYGQVSYPNLGDDSSSFSQSSNCLPQQLSFTLEESSSSALRDADDVTVIGYSDGFASSEAEPASLRIQVPAEAKQLKTPTRQQQRHPSQGKLRVINQGSLSVSENIQTPAKLDRRIGFEDRETPELFIDDDVELVVETLNTHFTHASATYSESCNVIQTPIAPSLLAMLSKRTADPAASSASNQEDGSRIKHSYGTENITFIERDSWSDTNLASPSWTVPDGLPREDSGSSSRQDIADGDDHVTANSGAKPSEDLWTLRSQEDQLDISDSSSDVNDDEVDDVLEDQVDAGEPEPRGMCGREGASSSQSTGRSALPDVSASNVPVRGDLGVRKDLTIQTAPNPGEKNVFQHEERPNEGTLPSTQDEPNGSQATAAETSRARKDISCLECPMVLSSSTQLRLHVKHAHQKQDILCCSVCKAGGIEGKDKLKIHMFKEHGIGEMFICEDCNFESCSKSLYARHMNQHAVGKDAASRRCHECGKEFKSRAGLNLHLKQHQDEGLFNCADCGFNSPLKTNFVKHMASRHKKSIDGKELSPDFACSFCEFKCVAECLLKVHVLRKHTSRDEMRFRCAQCNYASVEKSSLDKHVRFIHTKERPFMCNTCGFSTHTLSAMARHKRSHLQAKPFSCNICGKTYADRKRLRDHALKHDGQLPFECEYCGERFRRKDNLRDHVKRKHGVKDLSKRNARSADQITPPFNNSHIVGHVNQDGSIRPIATKSSTASVS